MSCNLSFFADLYLKNVCGTFSVSFLEIYWFKDTFSEPCFIALLFNILLCVKNRDKKLQSSIIA